MEKLRPGQTKLSFDTENLEVTYTGRPRDHNAKPFKPLAEMTMKMLADAVNHSKLKKQIGEEVKSEQSAKK